MSSGCFSGQRALVPQPRRIFRITTPTYKVRVASKGHGALKQYSTHVKILGSTATVDARAHNGMTGSGGAPVYWLNGARVADDNDDFFDGSWTNKNLGRGADGELLDGSASRQILCTGSADDGTATSVRTTSSTLGGRTLDVDNRARYLALSGVFRVAASSRPRVESVAITSDPGSDGEYVLDDLVAITVTFSEAVTVAEEPRIRITPDSGTRSATYVAMPSTSTELVFQYQVKGTDTISMGSAFRRTGSHFRQTRPSRIRPGMLTRYLPMSQ